MCIRDRFISDSPIRQRSVIEFSNDEGRLHPSPRPVNWLVNWSDSPVSPFLGVVRINLLTSSEIVEINLNKRYTHSVVTCSKSKYGKRLFPFNNTVVIATGLHTQTLICQCCGMHLVPTCKRVHKSSSYTVSDKQVIVISLIETLRNK